MQIVYGKHDTPDSIFHDDTRPGILRQFFLPKQWMILPRLFRDAFDPNYNSTFLNPQRANSLDTYDHYKTRVDWAKTLDKLDEDISRGFIDILFVNDRYFSYGSCSWIYVFNGYNLIMDNWKEFEFEGKKYFFYNGQWLDVGFVKVNDILARKLTNEFADEIEYDIAEYRGPADIEIFGWDLNILKNSNSISIHIRRNHMFS